MRYTFNYDSPPPSYWTKDLNGKEILVTLLVDLENGKYRALDEESNPLVVASEHLENWK